LRKKMLELLETVGLAEARKLQLRKFSKGMVQRVGIAQALINDPEVVFLDEPMSGLDPLGRREVRLVISSLRTRGATVFFSSHILPDVEALCDRVAIMNRGKLLELGALDAILNVKIEGHEIIVGRVPPGLADRFREVCDDVVPLGDRLHMRAGASSQVD